jgi:hypothetical protein
MKAVKATLIFAATFALVSLGDAAGGVESWRAKLLGFALLVPIATLAFWLGARRTEHLWYSAPCAAVCVFAILSTLFRAVATFHLSRWSFLSVVVVILVAASMFFGRTPIRFGSGERAGSGLS